LSADGGVGRRAAELAALGAAAGGEEGECKKRGTEERSGNAFLTR